MKSRKAQGGGQISRGVRRVSGDAKARDLAGPRLG